MSGDPPRHLWPGYDPRLDPPLLHIEVVEGPPDLAERSNKGISVEEERVTNAETGGQKGQKLARFDLIPTGPLWKLAEHYGRGARKYEARNWEKSYAWSLSYAAMQRHLNQFWAGESIDEDTGGHHLAAAAFHCFALMEWENTHPELDDRPQHPSPDQGE